MSAVQHNVVQFYCTELGVGPGDGLGVGDGLGCPVGPGVGFGVGLRVGTIPFVLCICCISFSKPISLKEWSGDIIQHSYDHSFQKK